MPIEKSALLKPLNVITNGLAAPGRADEANLWSISGKSVQSSSIEAIINRTCDVGQMPLSQTLESAKSAIQLVKDKGNKVQQLLKLYTSANCWMQDIYMKAYRVSEYGPGKLRFISPEFVALDIRNPFSPLNSFINL